MPILSPFIYTGGVLNLVVNGTSSPKVASFLTSPPAGITRINRIFPAGTYPLLPDPGSVATEFCSGCTMGFAVRLAGGDGTEGIDISEGTVKLGNLVRIIDEFLQIPENVVVARDLVKIVSEILNIEELALRRILSSGVFITFKSRIKGV